LNDKIDDSLGQNMHEPTSLMRPTIRLLLLLVALATAGCDQQGAPAAPDPGPGITTPPVKPDIMPGAIGTLWIYRVTYPWAPDDIIQVRVVDTVRTVDGHLASKWEFAGSTRTLGTQYVAMAGDTIFFYGLYNSIDYPWNKVMGLDHIILLNQPVGRRWESSYADSTEITGNVSIDVPAGHYDDVTAMTRTLWFGPTSELWLKPHVGFVKMTDPFFQSHVPGEQWTLMRFLP
jgi:hypothetical protein